MVVYQTAVNEPHADWRVHRAILYYDSHLFLSHMVSGIFGSGRGMSILEAGFVASLPALCGFAGGVLGGIVSDILLKKAVH